MAILMTCHLSIKSPKDGRNFANDSATFRQLRLFFYYCSTQTNHWRVYSCMKQSVNTVCCFLAPIYIAFVYTATVGDPPCSSYANVAYISFTAQTESGKERTKCKNDPPQNSPNECSCPAGGSCVLLYRRGWQSDAAISTTQQSLKIRSGGAVCFDATV